MTSVATASLRELVGCRVASLDLGVAECRLGLVVTKVLTRRRVGTQDVAAARDRKALPARHVAIAGSCPKPSRIRSLDLRDAASMGSYDRLMVAIVVRYDAV